MPTPQWHGAIQAHRIFSLLSDQGQLRLAETLTLHPLDSGETLDLAGNPALALQWLVSGERMLLDDQRQPILVVHTSELLTSTAHPGIASAQAQTACALARLDAHLLETLREESAALAILLLPSPQPSSAQPRERNQADPARSVANIATLAPMTIDVQSPTFDALLLMARHNIHQCRCSTASASSA